MSPPATICGFDMLYRRLEKSLKAALPAPPSVG